MLLNLATAKMTMIKVSVCLKTPPNLYKFASTSIYHVFHSFPGLLCLCAVPHFLYGPVLCFSTLLQEASVVTQSLRARAALPRQAELGAATNRLHMVPFCLSGTPIFSSEFWCLFQLANSFCFVLRVPFNSVLQRPSALSLFLSLSCSFYPVNWYLQGKRSPKH